MKIYQFKKLITLELFEKDSEKRKNFWNSSRLLMNFLFSFIFGFGLTRLHDAVINPQAINLFKLFIAYITVFQAWISYNWVSSLKEEYSSENALIFSIDIGTTFIYFGIIDSYDKAIWNFLFLFFALHIVYVLWALIKYLIERKRFCLKRLYLNIVFLFLFLITYLVNILFYKSADVVFCIVVVFLMVLYRIIKLFPFYMR